MKKKEHRSDRSFRCSKCGRAIAEPFIIIHLDPRGRMTKYYCPQCMVVIGVKSSLMAS